MNARIFILSALLTLQCFCGFCQKEPPAEFYNGLDLMKTDQQLAKKDFLLAIQKDSIFNGSFHFLGVIYLNEQKPDSAIWCFVKSIALNQDNTNHTREFTYIRLINTYAAKLDFADAFAAGYDANKLYPDNKAIGLALKDVCLWAFYIKHAELNPSYILPDKKAEYLVNSVDEEYLILRKVRVNDEYLVMGSQQLIKKNGADYDVLKCKLSKSKQEVELNFKLNWDMNVDFGGKMTSAKVVIDDEKNPVYERVGAMLIADYKTDIMAAIKKMQK